MATSVIAADAGALTISGVDATFPREYVLNGSIIVSPLDFTVNWAKNTVVTANTLEDNASSSRGLPLYAVLGFSGANISVSDQGRIWFELPVLQDAVGRATRYPNFELMLDSTTAMGSRDVLNLSVDTSTGDSNKYGTSPDYDYSYSVVDDTTHWTLKGWVQKTLTGYVYFKLKCFPAFGASASWTSSATAMGTVTYGDLHIGDSIGGYFLTTGVDASLQYNRSVSATAGSMLVSGTPATFDLGFFVIPDAGVFLISGVDSSLTQGYSVSAETGSIDITGPPAALETGGNIDCLPGAYAISGVDSALTQGYSITADIGSVAISGIPATFPIGLVAIADAGTYLISGVPANLKQGYDLDATAGAILVDGIPASFEIGYSISAEAGSVAISGVDAVLSALTLVADVGSVAISGVDATFRYFNLAATAGAIVIGDIVGRETAATPIGGNLSNSASVDVGTNDNRFLVVGISLAVTTGGVLPTTITYAGQALTLIENSLDSLGNQHTVYGIVNPTAGSNTLLVEYAAPGGGYMEGPVITAHPYYNVVQDSVAAAVRDSVKSFRNNAGTLSLTLTGVIPSDMTVASAYNFNNTATGLSFSTLTERSDATFTSQPAQSSVSCEGAAADGLGVSTALITANVNVVGASLALIARTDATLTYVKSIPATAGAVVISGVPATLTDSGANKILAADAGSVAISGIDTTFNLSMAAGVGTVLITGVPATLTYTPVATIVANAGVFSISGVPATLAKGYVFNAGPVTTRAALCSPTHTENDLILDTCFVNPYDEFTGFTVPSDCDLLVISMSGCEDYRTPHTATASTSVTWDQGGDNQSLTLAVYKSYPTASVPNESEIWYLVNPKAGNFTLRITHPAAPAVPYEGFSVNTHYLKNVDTSNPLLDVNSFASSSPYTGMKETNVAGTSRDIGIAQVYNYFATTTVESGTTDAVNTAVTSVAPCVADTNYFTLAHETEAPGGYAAPTFSATGSGGPVVSVAVFAGPHDNLVWSKGVDATFNYWVLAANTGSIAITGIDSTFDFSMAADAGTFLITGVPATLTDSGASKILAADAGTFLITGVPATLTDSGINKILAVDAGTFLINGVPATLTDSGANKILAADAGSVAITGIDATFDFSMAADVGLVAINGIPASLERGLILSAAAGTVLISGAPATGGKPGLVIAEAGVFTIDGIPATFLHAYKISTVSDAVDIFGTAVDFIKGFYIDAASGTVLISGTSVITLGGVHSGVEYFPTGSTVTIVVFDNITGEPIAIDTNLVEEKAGTGRFIWNADNITIQPTGYQEYGYVMTDGITPKGGNIVMIDAATTAKINEMWASMELNVSPSYLVRDRVWAKPLTELTDTTTVGGYVRKKLLSVVKFLSLK